LWVPALFVNLSTNDAQVLLPYEIEFNPDASRITKDFVFEEV
jgi:hypothetical protein